MPKSSPKPSSKRYDIDAILAATDLAQLVEESGIPVRRMGKEHWARCPFHEERTASFHIHADGYFYCFGCHAKGSAIEFVKRLDNLTTGQAIRQLAERSGIEGTDAPSVTPRMRESAAMERMEANVFWAWQRLWRVRLAVDVWRFIREAEEHVLEELRAGREPSEKAWMGANEMKFVALSIEESIDAMDMEPLAGRIGLYRSLPERAKVRVRKAMEEWGRVREEMIGAARDWRIAQERAA